MTFISLSLFWPGLAGLDHDSTFSALLPSPAEKMGILERMQIWSPRNMEQSVCFMTVFNDSHFSRYELCLVQSEYSSENVVNKSKYRVQHLPGQEGRWVVFLVVSSCVERLTMM